MSCYGRNLIPGHSLCREMVPKPGGEYIFFCFSGWFCFSFVLFLRLSYFRERESKSGGREREGDSRIDSALGVEPDTRLDPTTVRS